jgi:hypothetical protein
MCLTDKDLCVARMLLHAMLQPAFKNVICVLLIGSMAWMTVRCPLL